MLSPWLSPLVPEAPVPAVFPADHQPVAAPIWREVLVGLDWLALAAAPVAYGLGVPRGAGAAVVLVPGFLGSDAYLLPLYDWLRRLGYRPFRSGFGPNVACFDRSVDQLLATVEAAHAASGAPVHLIGHSLGGLFARAAAVRRPERIASVVTLGSGFRAARSHPLVLLMVEGIRQRIQGEDRLAARRAGGGGPAARPDCYTPACPCATVRAWRAPFPPVVAQLAIYTRTDGVTDWRCCRTGDPATDYEVRSTHVGLAFNPGVWRRIALHLARSEEALRDGRR